MSMLSKLKKDLKLTINDFDDELTAKLEAAKIDLGMAGIHANASDAYHQQACIVYAKARFGNPANYQQLIDSYKDMKELMMSSSRYTEWGDGIES